jgi:hypothetical protein
VDRVSHDDQDWYPGEDIVLAAFSGEEPSGALDAIGEGDVLGHYRIVRRGASSIEYYEGKPHQVDGMSGATLTGNGLNQMLKVYLESYQNYFEKIESGAATASIK